MYAEFYDQLRTREGWQITEDIQFATKQTMTLTQGQVQTIPISFSNFPLLDLNQSPGAIAAYLVLRRLAIGNQKFITEREYTKIWTPDSDTSFGFLTGSNTITTQFQGQAPTQTPNASGNTFLKLIRVAQPPANLSINKIMVKAGYSSNYDNLGIAAITNTAPAQTYLDLQQWYGPYGMVAGATQDGNAGHIDIQIVYNNSSAGTLNSSIAFYGGCEGQNWGCWLVQYQDWQNGLHNIGIFDDTAPSTSYDLLRLIPIPITDNGQASTPGAFGNIVMTCLNSMPFFDLTSPYHYVLNASVAYLLPT